MAFSLLSSPLLAALRGAAAMAAAGEILYGQPVSLVGLAKEWEQDPDVRARFRQNKRLYATITNPKCFEPVCHVEQAGFNCPVLIPLVHRLRRYRAADGSVQLFSIAQVEAENLGDVHRTL